MKRLADRKRAVKVETSGRYRGRPLCIELTPFCLRLWPKGTRQAMMVPFEAVYDLGMKLQARALLAQMDRPRRRKGGRS